MSFIILDRDGVINYESPDYIKSPDEWRPIPGSLEAIAELNRHGFRVLVATNQSGVGRGYYDLSTLNLIHQKLTAELARVGAHIEEIFFCPHHPEENCNCRKPKAGLLLQMQKKYHFDFATTFFIGDSYRDVQAAQTAGCLPLLVLTGNGQITVNKYADVLVHVPRFSDLAEAVGYVINEFTH